MRRAVALDVEKVRGFDDGRAVQTPTGKLVGVFYFLRVSSTPPETARLGNCLAVEMFDDRRGWEGFEDFEDFGG